MTNELYEKILKLPTLVMIKFCPSDNKYVIYKEKVTGQTKAYYIVNYSCSFNPDIKDSHNLGVYLKYKKQEEKCVTYNDCYFEVINNEKDINKVIKKFKKLLLKEDFYSRNRIKNSIEEYKKPDYEDNITYIGEK